MDSAQRSIVGFPLSQCDLQVLLGVVVKGLCDSTGQMKRGGTTRVFVFGKFVFF